ncbi:CRISPR-associated endonuclease Cas1 [Fusobacterium necrophorum subsp. funduliforme]|uniref:hypothetical protein n=1 Tax=Fusobacterium necrophorum TaxID=859 RepID=UPI00370E63CC
MSNNVYKQLMFQTLRAGKQGNGTLLQVSLTRNGSLMFHMAQQNGINQNGLPTFDHQNASKFSFSNIESASIVNFIENAMQGELKKISFMHRNARTPKDIVFESSIYNNMIQFKISVFHKLQQDQRVFNLYLSVDEMEVIKENLKSSYNVYQKANAILALMNILPMREGANGNY